MADDLSGGDILDFEELEEGLEEERLGLKIEERSVVSEGREEERRSRLMNKLTASALDASVGYLVEKILGLGREERPIPIQSRMKARRPVLAAVFIQEEEARTEGRVSPLFQVRPRSP